MLGPPKIANLTNFTLKPNDTFIILEWSRLQKWVGTFDQTCIIWIYFCSQLYRVLLEVSLHGMIHSWNSREREKERQKERQKDGSINNLSWRSLTFGQGSPSFYLYLSPSLVPFPLTLLFMQANGSISNLSWLNLTFGQGSPNLLPFPFT